jgi:hypothetical protein
MEQVEVEEEEVEQEETEATEDRFVACTVIPSGEETRQYWVILLLPVRANRWRC